MLFLFECQKKNVKKAVIFIFEKWNKKHLKNNFEGAAKIYF